MRHPVLPPCRGRPAAVLVLAALTAGLAGCGTTLSRRTGDELPAPPVVETAPAASEPRDGPPRRPPPDLTLVPDAEPTVEPIRLGGPNKPYVAFGTAYEPIVDDRRYDEQGIASWYGTRFHGRRTSSGETYNMYAMTAAHRTLPIPSYARVRNPGNGRAVVVRINDRGPFHGARIIDLSYAAALKLGLLNGLGQVEVRRLTHEEIRAGTWRDAPWAGEATGVLASEPSSPAATGLTRGRNGAGGQGLVAGPAVGDMLRPTAETLAVAEPSPIEVHRLPAGETPPARATAPSGRRRAARPATPAEPGTAPPAIDADLLAPRPADLVAAQTAVDQVTPGRAFTPSARGYWVQLGAFRDATGAEAMHRRAAAEIDWLAPFLAVFHESEVHRLQAGPYPTRAEAAGIVRRVGRALRLVPVVVERR